MNAITNILKQLPGLKTSTDFAAAITNLEREHATALAAVTKLESQREDLIFSGGDLGKLEADINVAEHKAKTFTIAIEGAKKRQALAAEAEHQSDMEAVGNEAKKQTATLRKALAEFEETAAALAGHAENIVALRREIAQQNAKLRAGNRGDLTVADPLSERAQATGQLVVDPLKDLAIWGLWPHTRPKTLALARAG